MNNENQYIYHGELRQTGIIKEDHRNKIIGQNAISKMGQHTPISRAMNIIASIYRQRAVREPSESRRRAVGEPFKPYRFFGQFYESMINILQLEYLDIAAKQRK